MVGSEEQRMVVDWSALGSGPILDIYQPPSSKGIHAAGRCTVPDTTVQYSF
jgi:hypothetical protein